jgi:hypothetical protein
MMTENELPERLRGMPDPKTIQSKRLRLQLVWDY